MVFLLSVASAALLFSLNSCKKDDPAPQDEYKPPIHFKGDVEGWVTIDGVKSIVSGTSTESQYGFIITPRNMTPANSYPILTINFDSKPAIDSIYDLYSLSTSVSVTTETDDKYFVSFGNLDVKVLADSIVSSFEGLKAVKLYGTDTLTISGSATYYSNDIK